MNDRNKHKVTGQMNQQTADLKANASVFLFFPTAHFLKTIFSQPHKWLFCKTAQANPQPKFCKRAIFANARQNRLNTINKM